MEAGTLPKNQGHISVILIKEKCKQAGAELGQAQVSYTLAL